MKIALTRQLNKQPSGRLPVEKIGVGVAAEKRKESLFCVPGRIAVVSGRRGMWVKCVVLL